MRKTKTPLEPVVDEVRRIRAEMWRGIDYTEFVRRFDKRFPPGSYLVSPLRPKKPAKRKRAA
jgi:hypothetical protein